MCLSLVGCGSEYDTNKRVKAVSSYDYVTNVRVTAGGYIMYEIEDGTVTCREHSRRAELSCWRNGE